MPVDGEKRSYVRRIFTDIAPHYDRLNHLLSLNVDRRWRRSAVRMLEWEQAPGGTYLDLCAGTLDLAAELARAPGFCGRVVGADFVIPMLKLGRGKASRVSGVGADALVLPFPSGTFDGCLVGFGIRNLASIAAGLVEVARVLKPGGRLVVLEFSTPPGWPIRPLYQLYFRRVLPAVGRLISRNKTAYTYLPSSVAEFPDAPAFAKEMSARGFRAVGYRSLTFGIAMLHWGVAGGR